MKTMHKLLVGGLTSACVVISSSATAHGQAILKNPGFEQGGAYWEKSGAAKCLEAYDWHHYEGKWSYGIGNDGGPENVSGEFFQELRVPGKIEKGDLFNFGVWMQAEDRYSGKASLKIEFLNSENELLKCHESEMLSGKFDWTNVSVKGTAPEGVKRAIVKCASKDMATGQGFSFVWFDNAAIQCPVISASSTLEDAFAPENVMREGAWHSKLSDNQWIKIDLRQPKAFGGLSIRWGNDYPASYGIEISPDGQTWETIHSETDGRGGLDEITRNIPKTRYIKILCKSGSTKNGFAIQKVDLKSWRNMSKHSRLDTVRGLVGWENCKWKTFVGRDGSFAPDPHSFMIGYWLYDHKLKRLHTPETLPTTWKSGSGGVPVSRVEWKTDDIEVSTTVFANWVDELDDMVTFARTSMKNIGGEKRDISLYALIHPSPLHPEKIKKIEYDGKYSVKIDGKRRLFLKQQPNSSGIFGRDDPLGRPRTSEAARPYHHPIPDYREQVAIEEFGEFKVLGHKHNTIVNGNGALVYRDALGPGEETECDLFVSCQDQSEELQGLDFSANLTEVEEFWRRRIPLQIKLPDDRYTDCFYASAYYQLIMMEDYKLYPGPLNYKAFFLHDAVDMVNSLNMIGLHEVAEKALAHFDYKEEGDNYLDGLGGNIFALYEHYRITKDRAFLKRAYPRIIEKCRLIKRLRAKQLDPDLKDTATYGLLPPSLSQDNWKFPSHLYVDDWWAIVGLKSGLEAAKALGKANDTSWLTKEYEDFLKCLHGSFEKAMQRDGTDYIPGFADFWPPEMRIVDDEHRILGDTQMAWAHRPALVPGQSLSIDIPFDILVKSYNRYWERAGKFSDYDGGWYVEYERFFWGYNVMIAHPLLHLGMTDIALKSLLWSIEHQSCPGGWSEAMKTRVNDRGLREIAEGVVGDVPHGWVAAHYILFLRDMLLRERGEELVILPCVPEDWLQEGKVIEVKNAPTYFGTLSYTAKCENDAWKVMVWGDAKPPGGFSLNSAFLKRNIGGVTINDKVWKQFSDTEVRFGSLPAEIIISY